MPLYHFETLKNGHVFWSEQPLEMADMNEAWEEATIAAGQAIRDIDGSLTPGTQWSIVVEDVFKNMLRTLEVKIKAHK